ncbi:hypothetical protein CEUSTIGMA_g7312.t1 [Chlamydomonas eustigma]|uniref:Cyclic nucleotide-binding domain-containing protein n=1 Tax=Chlamydomonas eustigma TaxID=1157962 RepID=A0A250XAI7_9CHLO|nr:hypothetical protein CEUSTIGMA_g7312.t1 [Chlamydomonas eustigma]|eukprot:GAX79872.1 hypothetical protein CEUSTIGMA_g7312.t1 [Chlamydomonas eustigma]
MVEGDKRKGIRASIDISSRPIGLDICLPALQRFELESSGNAPLTSITERLQVSLGKNRQPSKLPQAVRSYYEGPMARGYMPVDLDMHVAGEQQSPSRFTARVSSSRVGKPQSLQVNTSHTEVLSGALLQSGTQSQIRSARLAPLMSSQPEFGDLMRSSACIPPGGSDKQAAPLILTSPETGSSSLLNKLQEGSKAADISLSGHSKGNISLDSETSSKSVRNRQASPTKPVTPQAKFTRAAKNLIDKVTLFGLEGVKSYRSRTSRIRANAQSPAQRYRQVLSKVQLPATPTQMMTSTSGKTAGLIERVLVAEGYMRTNMRKITDQLSPFRRLDEDLKDHIASCFQTFEYPAGSQLLKPEEICSEAYVLLSGQILLHQQSADCTVRPERHLPGTVLALELMLHHQASSLPAYTDPNLPTVLAVLTLKDFEAAIGSWAAQQVVDLIHPQMQMSMEAGLRSVAQQAAYVSKEAGETVFVEGDDADSLILMIQGQVLLTGKLTGHVVQTESHICNQLGHALGPTTAAFPLEKPGSRQGPMARGVDKGKATRRTALADLLAPQASLATSTLSTSATLDSGIDLVYGREGPHTPIEIREGAGPLEAAETDHTGALPLPSQDLPVLPAADSSEDLSLQDLGPSQHVVAVSTVQPKLDVIQSESQVHADSAEALVSLNDLGINDVTSLPILEVTDSDDHQHDGTYLQPKTENEQSSRDVHVNPKMPMANTGESALAALHPPPKQLSRFSLPLQDAASHPGEVERSQVSSAPPQAKLGAAGSVTSQDAPAAALGKQNVRSKAPVAAPLLESSQLDMHDGVSPTENEQIVRGLGSDLEASQQAADTSFESFQEEKILDFYLEGGADENGPISIGVELEKRGEGLDRCLDQESFRSYGEASGDSSVGDLQAEPSLRVIEEGTKQGVTQPTGYDSLHVTSNHEAALEELQLNTLPTADSQEGSTEQVPFPPAMENAEGPLFVIPADSPLLGVADNVASKQAPGVASPLDPPPAHDELHPEHSLSMLPIVPSTLSSDLSCSSIPLPASESQSTLVRKSIKEKLQGLAAASSEDPRHQHSSPHKHHQGPPSEASSSKLPTSLTRHTSEAEGKPSNHIRRTSLADDKKFRRPSNGSNQEAISRHPKTQSPNAPGLTPAPTSASLAPVTSSVPPPSASEVQEEAEFTTMPFYTALAALLKLHKQEIRGAFALPVFLGEEAAQREDTEDKVVIPFKRSVTAIAIQPCQIIIIPRSRLLSLHLSERQLRSLRRNVVQQQVYRQGLTAEGQEGRAWQKEEQQQQQQQQQQQGSSKGGWPEAAEVLREYLRASPAARPMWQVEALAEAFSSLDWLSRCPWQTRLKLFQNLQLLALQPGQQIPLARKDVSVVCEEVLVDPVTDQKQHSNTKCEDKGSQGLIIDSAKSRMAMESSTRPVNAARESAAADNSSPTAAPPTPGFSPEGSCPTSSFPLDGQTLPQSACPESPATSSIAPNSAPPSVPSTPQRKAPGSIESMSEVQEGLSQAVVRGLPVDSMEKTVAATASKQRPVTPDGVGNWQVPLAAQPSHSLLFPNQPVTKEASLTWDAGQNIQCEASQPSVSGECFKEVADATSDGKPLSPQQASRNSTPAPAAAAATEESSLPDNVALLDDSHSQAAVNGDVKDEIPSQCSRDESAGEDGGLQTGDAEQRATQLIPAASIPKMYANYDLLPAAMPVAASATTSATEEPVQEMRSTSEETVLHTSASLNEEPWGDSTAPHAAVQQEVTDRKVVKKRIEMLSKLDDRLFVVISGHASIHVDTVVTELAVEASASDKEVLGQGEVNMDPVQKALLENRKKLASFLQQLQPTKQEDSEVQSVKTEKMKSCLHHLSTLGFGEVITHDRSVAALDSSTILVKGKVFKPGSSGDPHIRDAAAFSQVLTLGIEPTTVSPTSAHLSAEVLVMDCPLYNMLTSERRMDKRAARLAMSRVFWWKLCNPDCFVDKVTCRVEDFKQGTELLRRGEVAVCTYIVLSGECVLRGARVGLTDEQRKSPTHETNLRVLREGDSAGELSLLSDRELWYTMTVVSTTAEIVCVDHLALLEYFEAESHSESGGPGVKEMLVAVAEEDRRLYSLAVQRQALMIQSGELELSMFNPSMKALLKHVMDLGNLDARELQKQTTSSVLLSATSIQDQNQQQQQHKLKSLTAVETTASMKTFIPVVMDTSNQSPGLNLLLQNMARPHFMGDRHELKALATFKDEVLKHIQFVEDIYRGSHVSRLPPAPEQPVWDSSLMREMMLRTRRSTAAGVASDNHSPSTVLSMEPSSQQLHGSLHAHDEMELLRIAMPVLRTAKEEGRGSGPAFSAPTRHRYAHQFNRHHMPRALRGADVDLMYDLDKDPAGVTLLSAEEVIAAINLEVHIKPRAANRYVGGSNGGSDGGSNGRSVVNSPPEGHSYDSRSFSVMQQVTTEKRGLSTLGAPRGADRGGPAWPLVSQSVQGRMYCAVIAEQGEEHIEPQLVSSEEEEPRSSQRVSVTRRVNQNSNIAATCTKAPAITHRAGQLLMVPSKQANTVRGPLIARPLPLVPVGRIAAEDVREQAVQVHVSFHVGEVSETETSQVHNSIPPLSSAWDEMNTAVGSVLSPVLAPRVEDILSSVLHADRSHASLTSHMRAMKLQEAIHDPAGVDSVEGSAGTAQECNVSAEGGLAMEVTEAVRSDLTVDPSSEASRRSVHYDSQSTGPPLDLPMVQSSFFSESSQPYAMLVEQGAEEEVEEDPLIQRLLLQAAASNRLPSPARSQGRSHETGDFNPEDPERDFPSSRKGLLLSAGVPLVRGPAWEQSEDGQTSSAVTRRAVWVRDSVHDPSGATNPEIAAKLTTAAQMLIPGARVELPVPPCTVIPEDEQKRIGVQQLLATFHLAEAPLRPSTGPYLPPMSSYTGSGSYLYSRESKPGLSQPPTGFAKGSTWGANSGAWARGVSAEKLKRTPPSPMGPILKTLDPASVGSSLSTTPMPKQGTPPSLMIQENVWIRSGSPSTPNFIPPHTPSSQPPHSSPALSNLTSLTTTLPHTRQGYSFAPNTFQRRPLYKKAIKTGAVEEEEEDVKYEHVSETKLDLVTLQQDDMVYVTMTDPPKPSTVPGPDQLNNATKARLAVLEAARKLADAAAAAAGQSLVNVIPTSTSEKLMAAASVSLVPTSLMGRAAAGQAEVVRNHYVPHFLRNKRRSTVPSLASKQAVSSEQWTVPCFNSLTGFEAGMEGENGVIYYD